MAGVQVPTPPDLGEHRLTKFEGTLRASIPDWWSKITGIRNGIRNRGNVQPAPAVFDEWEKTLTRVLEEMGSAATNLKTIQDDLNAARSEVAYRKSLVDAWPSGSLWDKISYIAITLFGAGGAAFFFFAANLGSNRYWSLPAIVLWSAGAVLLESRCGASEGPIGSVSTSSPTSSRFQRNSSRRPSPERQGRSTFEWENGRRSGR